MTDHPDPVRLGGQHRSPQGVSTFDDLTDEERAERRRRLLAELETEMQRIEDTGGASYW